MIVAVGNGLKEVKRRKEFLKKQSVETPSDGMVDMLVSKTSAERRAGSTPALETIGS